ncbi:unnamed protein product [Phytophthora lilii]|uniref:Unnamed protein product n=1 Tax=Phytophthora lilii TaxID=2077276 RepID=A0A9W6YJP5_9STRA|nr:unnamed protein product [Phytophthora lilii]
MTSNAAGIKPRSESSKLQRKDFKSFMETVLTCERLLQKENTALRAQVHDLTELLANYDLCELHDAHLTIVRDRAFGRDIAPDRELLQVYLLEQQVQSRTLLSTLNVGPSEQYCAANEVGHVSGHRESSVSAEHHALEVMSLRDRVGVLEREVVSLQLRHKSLEEATLRLACAVANEVDQEEDAERPSPHTSSKYVQLDTEHQAAVNHLVELDERAIFDEGYSSSARTIREQQERILDLERAIAATSARNTVLQQQNRRYHEMANTLSEI